jgi:hypothetical protein
MDKTTLVGDTVNEGQRILEQLARTNFQISAALWVKDAEKGEWYLYIVSPAVENTSREEGYTQLHAAIRTLPELLWMDRWQVRLIGPSSPIGRDILAVFNGPHGPKGAPRRWRGTRLGNMEIEGAYLYPVPVTVP